MVISSDVLEPHIMLTDFTFVFYFVFVCFIDTFLDFCEDIELDIFLL